MVEATPRFLGFKRHLRAEVKARDGAFLFSERGVIAMRGEQVAALAALLDGTRDFHGLLRARPAGMDERQIAALLGALVDAGLVALHGPDTGADQHSLAFWDECGVQPPSAEPSRVGLVQVGDDTGTDLMRRALGDAGLTVVEDPAGDTDLSVVLCGDYLDPRLGDVDRAHRAAGKPWLLGKPRGAQVWLGPILRPGDSACWHCLAHRLRGHRHAETCAQASLGRVGPAPHPVAAVPPLSAAAVQLIALEATKWLAGYRYPGQRCVWVLDSLDLRGTQHELRRRPQCPHCGDPSLTAARASRPVVLRPSAKSSRTGNGHRTRTPAEQFDRFRHLISPVTGVLREIRRDPDCPSFANAFRAGPNVLRASTELTTLRASLRAENGGKGVTALDAEVGALCEAVERYSGCWAGDEPTVADSLRHLGSDAVHPNDCLLFDERQYRDRGRWNARHASFQHVCAPFDEDAVRDWTPVWSLTEHRQRLLPTAQLYYGAPTRPDVRADSNGAAAGSSLEDAVLQGLLEVVERDAVALWWFNRTQMPGVDIGSFRDRWMEEMVEQYAGIGRQLWALDLTSDLGVPAFAAVSRRTGGPGEAIMFGFGSHLDPHTALRRAVTELNQMLPAVLHDRPAPDDPDAAAWLATATVANQPYLLPLAGVPAHTLDDHAYQRREDLRDDVTALVELLRRRGLETLVLDQTRPDIEMPVVKVVVPGLRPFWARFAPGRLFDVPVRLGRLAEPTPYERLNPMPMFL